jgi:hypothetical protein
MQGRKAFDGVQQSFLTQVIHLHAAGRKATGDLSRQDAAALPEGSRRALVSCPDSFDQFGRQRSARLLNESSSSSRLSKRHAFTKRRETP